MLPAAHTCQLAGRRQIHQRECERTYLARCEINMMNRRGARVTRARKQRRKMMGCLWDGGGSVDRQPITPSQNDEKEG